jgi:O-glycosyl hydrolase
MIAFSPTKRVILSVLACLLVATLAFVGFYSVMPAKKAHAASSVTINGATTYQTIDGFGFSEAFGQASSLESSSAAQQVVNLLFSPTSGAGMTILRNLFPSDSGGTIEPNSPGSSSATPTYRALGSSGGQVWMAQQAKNNGVTQLYGDAWSAPGYMKTNGSESNGGTLCGAPGASSCSSGDWRQAYANYLVQYAKDYQSAGVPLTEIGAFNELNYTTNYSSMIMSPAQAADFIGILGTTVKSSGLSPQVVCCDVLGWSSAQSYAAAIEGNSATNIFSSHGYGGAPTFAITGLGSRHAWETEWSTFDSWNTNWDDGSDASGYTWANNIFTGLTSANLSAFLYWWGASNGTDNQGLIQFSGSSYTASKRLWAFANYSRYIRPGAVRIGSTSGDGNLKVLAAKNTDGTYAIVVLNASNSDTATTFSLQNVATTGTATPYITNNSNNVAQQSSIGISGSSFSATVPARSLVTYKITGSTTSPTSTPVPPTATSQPGTSTPVPPTATSQPGTATPVPPTATPGSSACKVSYAVSSQWSGGFSANVTIANTGSAAINGWTLKFTFPASGQSVTQGWSATWSQSGQDVTATNLSWNASLSPGASASIGFNGAWMASNPSPTSFTVNGVTCSNG